MKIFITGGTGFLGGFLIEELLKQGHKLVVLTTKKSSLKYIKDFEVKIFYGDVTDIESLERATKNIDIVIHLASLIHPVNVPNSLYYNINVKGTENVFNAAIKNNPKLKQFIHCSSVTVYGKLIDKNLPVSEDHPTIEQTTIYGITKYQGEIAIKALAQQNNIPLTIIRPSRIYGERDTSFLPICKLMKKKLFFNIGPGKSHMQPVYVKDCVQGILKTINNKKSFNKIYNLAGKEVINKKQFLNIMANNLGTEMPRINAPTFLIRILAIINEILFKPIKKDPFISRKKLNFFLRSNKYNISAAQKDLNYNPEVEVQEAIKRMVNWYKKENLI